MIQVIHKIAIRPARRKSSTLHSHLVNNALLLYKYQTINAYCVLIHNRRHLDQYALGMQAIIFWRDFLKTLNSFILV